METFLKVLAISLVSFIFFVCVLATSCINGLFISTMCKIHDLGLITNFIMCFTTMFPFIFCVSIINHKILNWIWTFR